MRIMLAWLLCLVDTVISRALDLIKKGSDIKQLILLYPVTGFEHEPKKFSICEEQNNSVCITTIKIT
jgi:hypothetical protein